MSQEDKLRDTLRDHYDTQQELPAEGEWERASAYLNAEKRENKIKRSAVIFTVLLFSSFLIVLLNAPESTPGEKLGASVHIDQKGKSVSASKPIVSATPMVTEKKKTIYLHNTTKGYKHPAHTTVAQAETIRNNLPAEPALSAKTGHADKTDATEPKPALISATAAANNNTARVTKQEASNDPDENEAVGLMPGETPVPLQDPVKERQQTLVAPPPQTSATVVLNAEKPEPEAETVKLTGPETIPIAAEKASDAIVSASVSATSEEASRDSLPAPKFIQLADEGIYYEAGAVWLYGWKGAVRRDARGFSPLVGINYMNRLNNHCALSFGVQYLMVPNLSNSSKTSRVSSYVYGEQSSVTVITPATLHYLVMPLRFNYYADHKNSFGGGVNLAYLLNVSAMVTTYDESAASKGNYKTVKQSGYNDGFSWFDAQLALFYRRRIGHSLSVQAEVFVGLTDVKQDAFFGFVNKERNSGTKFSLVYFPFRKKSRS